MVDMVDTVEMVQMVDRGVSEHIWVPGSQQACLPSSLLHPF